MLILSFYVGEWLCIDANADVIDGCRCTTIQRVTDANESGDDAAGGAAASQASGSGGDAASSAASDPRTICPLLPHSSMSGFVGGGGGRLLDQRSFRLAMENPHDYFVHDL